MDRRIARGALLLLAALGLLGLFAAQPARGAIPTVHRGPTDRPRIALTFDDNYQPARALATLRVLKQYDVDATVFVVGQAVGAYPSITQALLDPHFEVGDHTLSHRLLPGLPWTTLMREVGGGASVFHAVTGKRTVPLFRPPYGSINPSVAAAAGAKGYLYTTLWDIDTNDWQGRSASAIRSHVLANAHRGAIVLMHLRAPNTAAALPGIITGLRGRGYELVSLSKLLKGDRAFLDLPEGTAVGQAVLRLVARGVMSGYDTNYFGPADPMTRAQFAKVSVLVAGVHTGPVERTNAPSFVDVPVLRDGNGVPLAYPFDFIEEAAAAGFVQGRAGSSGQVFDPSRSITRGQLAQIVARMARELKGYPPSADGPRFADVPEYAVADVAFASQLGLMKGYAPDRFDPWSSAQRGHVAVVMTRFLDLPRFVPPPTTTTTTALSTTTTTTASPTTTTTSTPPPSTTTTTTVPAPGSPTADTSPAGF